MRRLTAQTDEKSGCYGRWLLAAAVALAACGGPPPKDEASCPDDWTTADACNALRAETDTKCHACSFDADRCPVEAVETGVWHQSGAEVTLGGTPGTFCGDAEQCDQLCKSLDAPPADCFVESDCLQP